MSIESIRSADILPENQAAARIWSAGGERYERISHQIADAIEHAVDRLAPRPGERILDVATGTGFAARRVRARGAMVVGADFAADVVQGARTLTPGGDVEFDVADAENLPYEDASFDGVISTFGVMFCANPGRAAAELARVTRPGGRLALATWATSGGIADMFEVIQRHAPKPPTPRPSPFAWGDPAALESWLGDAFEIATESATSYYREARVEDVWESFSTSYGPTRTLVEGMAPTARAAFRADIEALHAGHVTGAGLLFPRPYVITVGRRRG